MRWTELSIPTLRDEPSEGDRRRKLLVRAGYWKASGGPQFLGQRTLEKIDRVLRDQGVAGLRYCGVRGTAEEIDGDLAPELFHTPNVKTIAALASFTGLPETAQMKSVVMRAADDLVLVLVRGDHSLSEAKLRAILGSAVQPATAEQIRAQFNADPGSLGPVGLQGVRILADESLRGRRNMICGANQTDYHLRHVTPGEHFVPEVFDLRVPIDGPGQTGVPVRVQGGGLIGSVGDISAEYVLVELSQQNRDDVGLIMPPMVAPFSVLIVPVNIHREDQRTTAESLYEAAKASGCDALLDDRDLRPGIKFKDAELIGIPWRITIGMKLSEGLVEVQERRGKQSWDVPVAEAVEFVRARWDSVVEGVTIDP
ncbi:MAG: YbaK/EbsC family protein [Bryobacteraceae bacterium]